jgi:hypothetical protein
MEYAMTNNMSLAEKFLQQAATMRPDDAHVMHELAVLAVKDNQYERAYTLLTSAWNVLTRMYAADDADNAMPAETPTKLSTASGATVDFPYERCLRMQVPAYWHTLMHNLAVVCRKLGHIEQVSLRTHMRALWQALEFHSRCLHLRTNDAQTYAARALCHMWRDDWPSAVDNLHSSLALQPHQEHVVQMLSRAMEHMHVHPWLWAAHGGGGDAGELWPFTHVPADTDSLATALNLEHVSVADYANKCVCARISLVCSPHVVDDFAYARRPRVVMETPMKYSNRMHQSMKWTCRCKLICMITVYTQFLRIKVVMIHLHILDIEYIGLSYSIIIVSSLLMSQEIENFKMSSLIDTFRSSM